MLAQQASNTGVESAVLHPCMQLCAIAHASRCSCSSICLPVSLPSKAVRILPSPHGLEPLASPFPPLVTHSHTHLVQAAHLKDFAARCPHVAKLSSIGKSVEGLDLWVLQLGDRSLVDRPQPAFRYLANMHGDEPTGRCGSFDLHRCITDVGEVYYIPAVAKQPCMVSEVVCLPCTEAWQ